LSKPKKTRIRFDSAYAAMTIKKSRYWRSRMVYILRADRTQKYKKGRSRIVYIGQTRRGTKRPASSAAAKASRAFDKLRGVKCIDVHPVICRGRGAVSMWKILERDLLATFKHVYGEVPCYNQQGKGKSFSVENISYFREKRLKNVLMDLR
jgi:hypothetical protein